MCSSTPIYFSIKFERHATDDIYFRFAKIRKCTQKYNLWQSYLIMVKWFGKTFRVLRAEIHKKIAEKWLKICTQNNDVLPAQAVAESL